MYKVEIYKRVQEIYYGKLRGWFYRILTYTIPGFQLLSHSASCLATFNCIRIPRYLTKMLCCLADHAIEGVKRRLNLFLPKYFEEKLTCQCQFSLALTYHTMLQFWLSKILLPTFPNTCLNGHLHYNLVIFLKYPNKKNDGEHAVPINHAGMATTVGNWNRKLDEAHKLFSISQEHLAHATHRTKDL
uniref:Uncharacterized protein n=1 Tax=Strigamia maritima TaxID=126957 RepID=T1JDF6_STRMM